VATTASAGELYADAEIFGFVVEEMEGGKADVGKFLFAERDRHAGYEIRPLLNVARRHG